MWSSTRWRTWRCSTTRRASGGCSARAARATASMSAGCARTARRCGCRRRLRRVELDPERVGERPLPLEPPRRAGRSAEAPLAQQRACDLRYLELREVAAEARVQAVAEVHVLERRPVG